jgi:hypothetical protein
MQVFSHISNTRTRLDLPNVGEAEASRIAQPMDLGFRNEPAITQKQVDVGRRFASVGSARYVRAWCR